MRSLDPFPTRPPSRTAVLRPRRRAAASSLGLGLGLVWILAVAVVPARAEVMAYITNADSDSVSVIDTTTAEVVATIPVAGRPIGVAVDRTGSKVYVTNFDSHLVSVIDATSDTLSAMIPVGSNPNGIAVNAAGTRVFVANQGDDTVSIIDTETYEVLETLFIGCTLTIGVAVLPDNSRAYVSCAGDPDAVVVIDEETRAITEMIPLSPGSNPKGVTAAPDGSRVYVALATAGLIAVIDTASNQVVGILPVDPAPQIVAVHPDGSRIYVTSFGAGTLSVFDAGSFQRLGTVRVGRPLGVDLTPDGSKIFVADANATSTNVYVVDPLTQSIIDTVEVGSRPHAFGKFIRPGSAALDVVLDIRPGAPNNVVQPRSRGQLAVALLGGPGFNVADVDLSQLAFGAWEATPAHDLTHPDFLAQHQVDANGDGQTDLLLHFHIAETGVSCGVTTMTLRGRTLSGDSFEASDSIVTMGCRRPSRPGPQRARARGGRRAGNE